MAFVPIKMPQLGESIAEATIVRLHFKEGDSIQADADLIEVETNKAMMAVTAPCSGLITERLVGSTPRSWMTIFPGV
jgi:pyruvate/2-oxoglutarate dehydrogenase complex dihydrolipoamide acyltransferase (E2) component